MIQAFTQEENKISVWSISNGSISSQSFENAALPPVDDFADIAVVFDYKALCRSEEFFRQLPPEKVFDIKLACYVKDPACSAESLAECAARFLPPETTPENDGGKLLALYTLLADEMEKNPVFRQLEMPLSPVLAAMEMRGIILDKAALLLFKEKLEKSIVEAQNAVFSAAGKTFNINSSKQLSEILYNDLQLPPPGKKTKSGYSTDAEALEKLKDVHPVAGAILQYRQLTKLSSTYVESWLKYVQADGRLHTIFNMTATATGRLSSAEPNLQNIPVRSELGGELRKFLVAGQDHLLISADYSQIELRLLAHLSGDPVMQEAFRSNGDIHRATAMQIFNVAADEVTDEMRRKAKAVNFGIVYGISAFTLANDLKIESSEAKNYIKAYFEKYSGVKKYLDNSIKSAKANGFAQTVTGRKRYLPELASKNFAVRSFGERAALNMPIQGFAADLIKKAMIRVDSELKKAKLQAGLILQIHDELIVCAPEKEAAAATAILQNAMENVCELSVPLNVSISSDKHL